MLCRRCKGEFPDGSAEHIIPDGLGGKSTTNRVFCAECNVALSQLDKALIEQFDFERNLLEIPSDRGTPPRFLAKDKEGNAVRVEPGGKPVALRPQMTERTVDGRKTVEYKVPVHIWPLFKKHLEKKYGVDTSSRGPRPAADRPTLVFDVAMGGPEAHRAVAKIAYDLLCDHMARTGLETDLSEIESYLFKGTHTAELSMLDGRPEIVESVADFSNIIAIHINPALHNIVASITLLGSYSYSVLLSRNYSGDSACTLRMTNAPIDRASPDRFENLPLERPISTDWLLSRPYWPCLLYTSDAGDE